MFCTSALVLGAALQRTPLRAAPIVMASGAVTDWRQHLPNALTIGRVAALPVLVGSFYIPATAQARLPAALFAGIALTDFADGYLARRWNVQSDFGAFLDPVADKLTVCACLVILSGLLGPLVAIPTAVIVCRELAVSALREWMAGRGDRDSVAVGWPGKIKTATQMVAVQLLLLVAPTADAALGTVVSLQSQPLLVVGLGLLYTSTALTLYSGWLLALGARRTTDGWNSE